MFHLCCIGEKVAAACLLIDFRRMVGTLTDKVRIGGLRKTVFSEVVQQVQSIIGQLCLLVFIVHCRYGLSGDIIKPWMAVVLVSFG